MNRATWLQGRRMLKFRDGLSRWERRELSMMEAGELLGMSERQFRRYRERFEEEGEAGLVDRRLGKPSPKRIEAAEVDRMLQLYRTVYWGWNVKHFHEHGVHDHKFSWGYTWTKTQLHAAGLVERAKRRGNASAQAREEALREHDAAPGRLAARILVGRLRRPCRCKNSGCRGRCRARRAARVPRRHR